MVNEPVDPPVDSEEPPPVELCDGIDNDGDDGADEDWPELGAPCGDGVSLGECRLGRWTCAKDGLGVFCDGEVGPAPEACDGKDNDCDGLVDEEVLSVEQEELGELASIVAIDGGFVVSRLVAGMLRVETYDTSGTRTGHHDDLANPSRGSRFVESAAAGGRVLVALGQYRFYVVEARVDADMVPVILGVQELHDDWDQGIDWGIYEPPYHPRVSADPPRFVGHRDLITFALTPFGRSGLFDLKSPPTEAKGVPYLAYFDAAGAFAVWEQDENVRAGWLWDDGQILLEIDIGRGGKPAIGMGADGPGIAHLDSGQLLITELAGLTLQCGEERFCNDEVQADLIDETATTAMALAFDATRDTWVVAASEQLLLIGRSEAGPVVKQALRSPVGGGAPNRIDVAVSGGTAAFAQNSKGGDTVLTFMGCF